MGQIYFLPASKPSSQQQHDAAPHYQQPIKASEILAGHFCTFFHQTPCLPWQEVLRLCLPHIPAWAQGSRISRVERRGGAAALTARSGLHLERRTNCPGHPAQLCLAMAVPSSSSWLSPATLCSLSSPSCSCPCPPNPPLITQGTIAAGGPGLGDEQVNQGGTKTNTNTAQRAPQGPRPGLAGISSPPCAGVKQEFAKALLSVPAALCAGRSCDTPGATGWARRPPCPCSLPGPRRCQLCPARQDLPLLLCQDSFTCSAGGCRENLHPSCCWPWLCSPPCPASPAAPALPHTPRGCAPHPAQPPPPPSPHPHRDTGCL